MKYANKRQVFRRGGRFSKPPTLADMGFPVADGERTCRHCGHKWWPVLETGTCPNCNTKRAAVGD